jgi:hypothetical protein
MVACKPSKQTYKVLKSTYKPLESWMANVLQTLTSKL